MTVYDFSTLAIEDTETVAVFDLSEGTEVYRGPYRDIWYERCAEYEIASHGVENGVLVLNVDSADYLAENCY